MIVEITRESAISIVKDLLREKHERIVLTSELSLLEKLGLIENESRLNPIFKCYLTENEFQTLLSSLETFENSQLEELLEKLHEQPFGGYCIG